MPAIRRLLKHVEVATAGARRICHRNRKKHSIKKGEDFLLIRDQDGQGSKNYCCVCAQPILQRAQDDLNKLAAGLYPSGTANHA